MTVLPTSPDLWSRFEHLCRRCAAELNTSAERWHVSLSRDGQAPIRVDAQGLAEAIAQAVNLAEALGWHRLPGRA